VQDENILKSTLKTKKFLEAQGIAYEPSTPDAVLRGRAKARMKSIAEEGISPAAKKAKFESGGGGALSVKALKEIIEKMNVAEKTDKKHLRINFAIEDFSTNSVVVHKHEVGWPVTCNGFVLNGKCCKCDEYVPGIAAYQFKAVISDLDDSSTTVIANCSAGAGNSMFKVSPASFDTASNETKKDMIEKVLFVPLNAGIVLEFKKDNDYKTMISLYDVVHKTE